MLLPQQRMSITYIAGLAWPVSDCFSAHRTIANPRSFVTAVLQLIFRPAMPRFVHRSPSVVLGRTHNADCYPLHRPSRRRDGYRRSIPCPCHGLGGHDRREALPSGAVSAFHRILFVHLVTRLHWSFTVALPRSLLRHPLLLLRIVVSSSTQLHAR